jgi:hypothetical protein
MQYVQPYGISDPNASYINGDPSQARKGSIPPAECFEHPQREIINVIQKNQFIPTSADLAQMLEANRSQRCNFCKDTGSTNNLSVAYDPPLTAYTVGLPLRVQVHATNTGGVTIDAGAGRVGCKRPDGSNIQPGDMPAGGIVDLVFDGTNFQMVNYLGGASTGAITNVFNNIPYAVDVSTSPNIVTAHFTPAITAVSAGSIVLIKIANTCTGDTVVNIDALANMPVRADGALTTAARLLPGDIVVGDVKLFVYDGTNWWIAPNAVIPSSVTLNVPSTQFPDVATTLQMLSRKGIANNATVTIQLASGIYPPIKVNYSGASHLVIKGTMIGAAPGVGDWGASPANNLTMLRSRYGTELHAYNNSFGLWNVGPGCPVFQDMLVVGDLSSGSVGAAVDNSVPLALTMTTQNVSIAYCTFGFRAGGKLRILGGGVTGCVNGANAEGGELVASDFAATANSSTGVIATGLGAANCLNCYVNYNAYGLISTVQSYIGFQGGEIIGNSVVDAIATINASIGLSSVSIYTFSPPFNTFGNGNAIIYGG